MEETSEEKIAALEAVLFAVGRPVSLEDIMKALEVDEEMANALIDELSSSYEEKQRGIRIAKIDGAYQLCTKSALYPYISSIVNENKEYKLTDTVLETLSIIAYRQPVTRAEIEKIRGVSSSHAVNRLMDYGLIKEMGRLDAPGKPLLFGTTDEFLRCFGISSPKDIPVPDESEVIEFKRQAEEEIYPNGEVEV